jgi:choline dehydrogenase-like flavoprotein
MLFDVIVVGSGASGTFAAWQLKDRNVLMLDVGNLPPPAGLALEGNQYALRKQRPQVHDEFVGTRYESLHNIDHDYLSPKLKAPFLRYTIQDQEQLSPVESDGFYTVMSHAKGGLANAWGAGAFVFTDRDLSGFPVRAEELRPYYEELTRHIGISGANDDLSPYFTTSEDLQPPAALSRVGEDLLRQYTKNRKHFHRRQLHVGRVRLAVLTRDHGRRQQFQYDNLEFFKPAIPAIYNPAYTLDQLREEGRVTYRPGFQVRSYREEEDRVVVTARELATGLEVEFSARKLILSAGTLGTTKIVLTSHQDDTTRLPLLDNAISYIPFLTPRFIGAAVEQRSIAGGQLCVVYDGPLSPEPIQASFYGLSGPLRSDYLLHFPLSLRDNLAAAKYLSPAMAIVQVFYPDAPSPQNHVQLGASGALRIRYEKKPAGLIERHIISTFRRAGYLSHPVLCQYPMAGNSFHYAGTLPMKREPGRYETYPTGRLAGTRNVYIADGSNFTLLPSKNLTLTLMANALRIAEHVRRELV